jgi:hypothetical protein
MWGGTLDIKDTLLPFYENAKGWTDPRALERLISTIHNNGQSFN